MMKANKAITQLVATIIFLLLLVIVTSELNMFRTKPYPEVVFQGELLKVAEAIKDKDRDRILALGRKLDNIDQTGKWGITLLMFAAFDSNPVGAKALIELKADPGIEAPNLGNAAYIAVNRKSTDALKAMLEAGMSPDIHYFNQSIIFETPPLNANDALTVLVEFGADINARDPVGRTFLVDQIGTSFDECLYLLEQGADPEIITYGGLSLAFSVQEELDFMDKSSEAYKKMGLIKQKLVEQGIQFPALSPQGEMIARDIVWCDEPEGYFPRKECQLIGINEYEGRQSEHIRKRDEQILKDRYNIVHKF